MDTIVTNSPPLSEPEFLKISRFIYEHCGINLHDGKKELVHARLAKRLRMTGYKKFSDYIEHVFSNTNSDEFSLFIDSLSTNLTSFFREDKHFNLMASKFLPEMLVKKQSQIPRIRIWSAGCSSGQEPYSIAITLNEALTAQQLGNCKILATDISTTMLQIARRGVYCQEKIAQIPADTRYRYFNKCDINGQKGYQAVSQLRNMIIFKHLNLMENWPISSPLDFIFCRNVMIYFDKPTQQKLVNRFWQLLGKGGVLFTGHSESLTNIEHSFKYISPTVYMKG